MNRRTHRPSTTPSSLSPILKDYIEASRRQIPTYRPRILIVEDHAETALLMQYGLRQQYRTDVVATADAALQQVTTTAYDGFLVDIGLRGHRNGIDVLEALRTQYAYQHTPIVAVTAHALPGDRQRFLDAGFDDHVAKPFTAEVLRDTLRTHIPAPYVHPVAAGLGVPVES
jgi:CheY-like chemotaxis protein